MRARAAGSLSTLLLVGACTSAPPAGTPGPQADARARKMIAAVNGDAWAQTGAARWVFRGANRHLWDRRRGFSRVRWDEHEVLFAIDAREGVAFSGGERVDEERARELLDEAHAKWTNDAFWLNPVTKAFDPGTVREIVPPSDGRPGLLVRYRSGGRTPGDAYLWWLDPDGSGRPVAWQMWTSNIPIGGVEASWEGWETLATGARVATKHEMPLFTLELRDVAGAETLDALDLAGEGARTETAPAADPFAPLVRCREAGACVSF